MDSFEKHLAEHFVMMICTIFKTSTLSVAPVMLFMKGSPKAPQCGFSRQITEILKSNDIPFASFDILTDERVRSELKKLSDWPTYPQLYVSGEFVGGLDVIKEIASSGNLASELGTETIMHFLAFLSVPLNDLCRKLSVTKTMKLNFVY